MRKTFLQILIPACCAASVPAIASERSASDDFAGRDASDASAFSASAWVLADSFCPAVPVFSKVADPDSWTDGFALCTDDKGVLSAFFGPDPAARRLTASVALEPGTWHFVELVSDGSVSGIWLDGECVALGFVAAVVPEEAPFSVGAFAGREDSAMWHGDIQGADFAFLEQDGLPAAAVPETSGLESGSKEIAPLSSRISGDGSALESGVDAFATPTRSATLSIPFSVRVSGDAPGTSATTVPSLAVWTPSDFR